MWRRFSVKCKLQRGFMLADSLLAIVVVTVGLTALLGSYIYGIQTVGKSDSYEKAVQVAAERIEVFKSAEGKSKADLETLIDKSNEAANKQVTVGKKTYTVETEEPKYLNTGVTGDNLLAWVTVKVTWENSQEGVMELETYITTSG